MLLISHLSKFQINYILFIIFIFYKTLFRFFFFPIVTFLTIFSLMYTEIYIHSCNKNKLTPHSKRNGCLFVVKLADNISVTSSLPSFHCARTWSLYTWTPLLSSDLRTVLSMSGLLKHVACKKGQQVIFIETYQPVKVSDFYWYNWHIWNLKNK